jgi:hypothetical protein
MRITLAILPTRLKILRLDSGSKLATGAHYGYRPGASADLQAFKPERV